MVCVLFHFGHLRKSFFLSLFVVFPGVSENEMIPVSFCARSYKEAIHLTATGDHTHYPQHDHPHLAYLPHGSDLPHERHSLRPILNTLPPDFHSQSRLRMAVVLLMPLLCASAAHVPLCACVLCSCSCSCSCSCACVLVCSLMCSCCC